MSGSTYCCNMQQIISNFTCWQRIHKLGSQIQTCFSFSPAASRTVAPVDLSLTGSSANGDHRYHILLLRIIIIILLIIITIVHHHHHPLCVQPTNFQHGQKSAAYVTMRIIQRAASPASFKASALNEADLLPLLLLLQPVFFTAFMVIICAVKLQPQTEHSAAE